MSLQTVIGCIFLMISLAIPVWALWFVGHALGYGGLALGAGLALATWCGVTFLRVFKIG